MKYLKDLYFLAALAALLLPFLLVNQVYELYYNFNHEHGLVMSFIKFAVLATLGEVIGLRIKTGAYHQKGFGILPRAIVWGCIGITIFMAFTIFAHGTPALLEKIGMEDAGSQLGLSLSWRKVLVAFSISTALNLFYAPVMMTFHRITDIHIVDTGGTLRGFFTPIPFVQLFKKINWDVQWNFVFKRTIPLFWIPAQTITFLLPEEFRVLFAAFLGIVLGVLLAIAALKK